MKWLVLIALVACRPSPVILREVAYHPAPPVVPEPPPPVQTYGSKEPLVVATELPSAPERASAGQRAEVRNSYPIPFSFGLSLLAETTLVCHRCFGREPSDGVGVEALWQSSIDPMVNAWLGPRPR